MFEDKEVPLHPALIKTSSKMDWTAPDLGKRAALVNAEKGISTFVMIDISEEDTTVITQQYKDLQTAATVSAKEVRKARSKVTSQTPMLAEEFTLMLK